MVSSAILSSRIKLAVAPASETFASSGKGVCVESSKVAGGGENPSGDRGSAHKKSKRAIAADRREEILARLSAEQDRGWPRSSAGVWVEDMNGYAPLDDIPVRDIAEFGLEGLEPMAPGEAELLDRKADLFEDLDKVDRKRAMRGQYPHYMDVA